MRKTDLSLSHMETFMKDVASKNDMLALQSYCENLPFLASNHLFAACVREQIHKYAPRQCHTSSVCISYADTYVCMNTHHYTPTHDHISSQRAMSELFYHRSKHPAWHIFQKTSVNSAWLHFWGRILPMCQIMPEAQLWVDCILTPTSVLAMTVLIQTVCIRSLVQRQPSLPATLLKLRLMNGNLLLLCGAWPIHHKAARREWHLDCLRPRCWGVPYQQKQTNKNTQHAYDQSQHNFL